MKNIKKNIFGAMMIVASVSRIETHSDQQEYTENAFTKMAAMQEKKAKRATKQLEAEAREAAFKAEMSAFQIELKVMPVETEVTPREMDAKSAENLFRQCLIKNRHSFDIGQSEIPQACEDFARILRLLGGSFEADELIEAFQQ